MLSSRAKALLRNPSAIVVGHEKCAGDPFSKENPEGMLNFGIAENRLIDDLALEVLQRNVSYSKDHIHYPPLNGLLELRSAFAAFAKEFLNTGEIDSEQVVVQSGLSSVCESLSFCLFDEGDELIVPAPFYSGFKFDFESRFKVELVPVQLKNFEHNIADIEKAITPKTKGILLTNPHNPLGDVLTGVFLQETADLCKKKSLHLISDEIYALSIHDQREHVSILEVEKDYENIHFLYGMAKDFGLAGLKTGFYHTRNQKCLEAMQALSYFHPVSTHTQALVADFLRDLPSVRNFVKKANHRTSKAFNALQSSLPHLKMIEPEAGMFFMADLRHLLAQHKNEEALFNHLLTEIKINMTPGTSMGLEEEGFFRLCYARSNEEIEEFSKRMKKLL